MFFKQNQLYMILQNNPHLKIERLLGGVKPRCTKLDRNFFLWLFNVFFVDFRLAEYIYLFTLFLPSFFDPPDKIAQSWAPRSWAPSMLPPSLDKEACFQTKDFFEKKTNQTDRMCEQSGQRERENLGQGRLRKDLEEVEDGSCSGIKMLWHVQLREIFYYLSPWQRFGQSTMHVYVCLLPNFLLLLVFNCNSDCFNQPR